MTSALTLIAAEGGHHVVNELPVPPITFGFVALGLFMAALGLLYMFRNTLALDPHGVAQGRQDPDVRPHPDSTRQAAPGASDRSCGSE